MARHVTIESDPTIYFHRTFNPKTAVENLGYQKIKFFVDPTSGSIFPAPPTPAPPKHAFESGLKRGWNEPLDDKSINFGSNLYSESSDVQSGPLKTILPPPPPPKFQFDFNSDRVLLTGSLTRSYSQPHLGIGQRQGYRVGGSVNGKGRGTRRRGIRRARRRGSGRAEMNSRGCIKDLIDSSRYSEDTHYGEFMQAREQKRQRLAENYKQTQAEAGTNEKDKGWSRMIQGHLRRPNMFWMERAEEIAAERSVLTKTSREEKKTANVNLLNRMDHMSNYAPLVLSVPHTPDHETKMMLQQKRQQIQMPKNTTMFDGLQSKRYFLPKHKIYNSGNSDSDRAYRHAGHKGAFARNLRTYANDHGPLKGWM